MSKISSPELSVIIVSWNVKEYLRNCLVSVTRACRNLNFEIIVIDNASYDHTQNMIKKEFPEINLIANPQNLGFSKANNQGSKISKGEYLLFLNPDTLVNQKAVDGMLRFLKENLKAGIVGPEQLNERGNIIFNLSRWSWRGIFEFLVERGFFLSKGKFTVILSKPYQTRFLNGGCWLVRRQAFEDVGGLDEALFIYGEDLDFCARTRKIGWQIWFLRNYQIIHFREKSINQTGKKKSFAVNGYCKVIKKWRRSIFR